MNVVVDASAAVGLVLAVPAAQRFVAPLEEADLVMVPDLYVAEVCNTLWKYRKAELLSMPRCQQAVEQALSLPDLVEPSTALHLEAFALACRHSHPIYDALYLVLARRNNAVLLTLDHRLAALAGQLEIEIVIPASP